MRLIQNWLASIESKTLLKIGSFVAFTIICLCQCLSILSEYLQYPTRINLYDDSVNLLTILPGLTICNNNRASVRKLVERNETFGRKFREKFSKMFDQDFSLIEPQDFRRYRDELSELFEVINYLPPSDLEAASMNRWFELRPGNERFINWFACAQTWHNSIDCDKLTRIDSMTNRFCTTLLHKGAMLFDMVKRPELFNGSTIALGAKEDVKFDSLNYFDAKEVIKLVIDFHPEDYGDLRRQIGARIIFHDNNHVAAMGDLDFFITRGFRYDFSVDRRVDKLIGPPYDFCLDYDAESLAQFEAQVEPRVPLGHHTCLQNCVVRNIFRRSKCWPQTMPYFRNDSLDPDLSVGTCSWLKNSQHFSIVDEYNRVEEYRRRAASALNRTIKSEQPNGGNQSDSSDSNRATPSHEKTSTYHKIRRFCWAQCSLSCKIVSYSVTLTRSVWPSDVKVSFDQSGKARRKRHCCALVAIKYLHYHQSINEYGPKLDAANTIGDVGGLLAVWLGLSIVSIYHALQKLVAICTRRTMQIQSA